MRVNSSLRRVEQQLVQFGRKVHRRFEPQFEPIFILAPPRSGTTFLNHVLGFHPSIANAPETYLLETIHAIITTSSDRHRQTKQGILQDFCSEEYLYRLCRRFFYGVIESHLHGKRYFLEKTPQNTRFVNLISKVFPNSRIIQLVRDPRDTIYSMLRAREELGHHYPDSVKGCAERWLSTKEVIDFGERYPERYVRVRYEDLVFDLRSELKQIFKQLQIQIDATSLDLLCKEAETVHHPSKDSLKLGFCGKWRFSFSDLDLEIIRDLAGPLASKLGYHIEEIP
jgi:hypothetical protein